MSAYDEILDLTTACSETDSDSEFAKLGEIELFLMPSISSVLLPIQ